MRQQRGPALLGYVVLFVAAAVLVAMGHGALVLLLWVLPGCLAIGLLGFAFDWLPHHPHCVQGRYIDTRVVLVPGSRVLLLGQDLHAVHHLWPRVPFYR